MKTASNSRVLRTIPLLIAVCLVSMPAQAQYSGGTGEPNDPYQIATPADLILLGESPGDYDKHFILTADIDLDPNLSGRKVFDRAVIAPDVNDAVDPWGRSDYDGTQFAGVFEGNGHVIRNLHIQGGGFLGLFGQLGFANISNFALEAVDVNGTGSSIGGLVGGNGGSITTSYSTGTVTGNSRIGGLVGDNGGSITTCYSTGSVTGNSCVGGLVGENDRGSITNCYSTGSVSGDSGIGGLVGNSENEGVVIACYSTGTVSGTGSSIGGLVGILEGTITSSYSTGTVTGTNGVGGLLGYEDGGIVAKSYSIGRVSGTGSSVGGLVGRSKGGRGATASVWDTETSGQTTSVGGVGLTTIEMMDPEMLGLNGLAHDPNWALNEGQDYPRLAWEGTAGQIIPEPVIDWLNGQGTEEEPYRIDTAEQLILLGKASILWDKHFILGADIDLDPNLQGRQVFSQAVIQIFSGVFDGNGHTISHLTIRGGEYLGLFGASYGTISNLGLKAVDIDGDRCVGGLLGYGDGSLVGGNGGSITTSCSTATVSGDNRIGGLVGSNYSVSLITSSYSTGSVSGDSRVGGLVGDNRGTVANSYSTGMVTGNENVGGLVGSNSSNRLWPSNGSITSSFWDIETSDRTNMCGIQEEGATGCNDWFGKTTAEMQTASTFLDAGWDFVGESVNGTDDIWSICEGTNYPRLVWQIPAGDFVCPDGITIEDFVFFAEYWGNEACDLSNDYCEGTDLDFSGTVDEADLEILVENWLAETQ